MAYLPLWLLKELGMNRSFMISDGNFHQGIAGLLNF